MVREFFGEIDGMWRQAQPGKVKLSLIGSGALVLQTNYERATKDSDVFETTDLTDDTKRQLLAIAGIDTDLHRKRRMYIDIVSNGVPFLPHVPTWVALPDLTRHLTHFEIVVLSVVDVLVSKLKRFSATDRDDFEAMIARGLVTHRQLVERFVAAVDELSCDQRAVDLRIHVANLHMVERDMFGEAESDIELPGWI